MDVIDPQWFKKSHSAFVDFFHTL